MRFLLAITLCIFMCSCSIDETVRVDDAKNRVASIEQMLAGTVAQLNAIKAQLAEARKIAEETKSEAAIKVIAQLEKAALVTESAIPHLNTTLESARKTLAEIEASGAESVSIWKLGVALVVPFLPRLLALIPGIGAFAAPLALGLGNIAHRLLVTGKQGKQDDLVYARAEALPHQVAVTHEALAALSETEQQRIKDAARKAQEQAGVYDIIRPLVLAKETPATQATPTSFTHA